MFHRNAPRPDIDDSRLAGAGLRPVRPGVVPRRHGGCSEQPITAPALRRAACPKRDS